MPLFDFFWKACNTAMYSLNSTVYTTRKVPFESFSIISRTFAFPKPFKILEEGGVSPSWAPHRAKPTDRCTLSGNSFKSVLLRPIQTICFTPFQYLHFLSPIIPIWEYFWQGVMGHRWDSKNQRLPV